MPLVENGDELGWLIDTHNIHFKKTLLKLNNKVTLDQNWFPRYELLYKREEQ